MVLHVSWTWVNQASWLISKFLAWVPALTSSIQGSEFRLCLNLAFFSLKVTDSSLTTANSRPNFSSSAIREPGPQLAHNKGCFSSSMIISSPVLRHSYKLLVLAFSPLFILAEPLNIANRIYRSGWIFLPFLYWQLDCCSWRDQRIGFTIILNIKCKSRESKSPLDCKEIQPVHPKGD